MKTSQFKKLIKECIQEVISERISIGNKNANAFITVLSKKFGEDLDMISKYNPNTKLIKIDLMDFNQRGINGLISSTNAIVRLPQLAGKFKLLKNDDDWEKLISINPEIESEYSNDHLVIYVK